MKRLNLACAIFTIAAGCGGQYEGYDSVTRCDTTVYPAPVYNLNGEAPTSDSTSTVCKTKKT